MSSLRFSACLLLVCLSLVACENDIEKVKVFASDEDKPLNISYKTELIYSDSANLQMTLYAGRMERYGGENPYTKLEDSVQVIFYDAYGEEESRLTSERAVNKENERIMEARNNVIVINKNGETLNTEHLIWNEKTEQITTDEFVKITTEDEIIFGDGLEANQDFTRYKIKNIKGTIQINEEDSTDIEANESVQ